jgi:large subunit ribosomal protein L22
MRLVASLVKGLPIEKALDILNFTPKIAARHLAKTLKSAAANALSLEGTDQLRPEDLIVKRIVVETAPTQKRVRFQSMGRVFRIRKRYSHLTVVVEEIPHATTPVAKPRGGRKAAAEEGATSTTRKRKAPAKKKTAKKTAKSKASAKSTKSTKATSKSKSATPKKAASKTTKKASKPKANDQDKE